MSTAALSVGCCDCQLQRTLEAYICGVILFFDLELCTERHCLIHTICRVQILLHIVRFCPLVVMSAACDYSVDIDILVVVMNCLSVWLRDVGELDLQWEERE